VKKFEIEGALLSVTGARKLKSPNLQMCFPEKFRSWHIVQWIAPFVVCGGVRQIPIPGITPAGSVPQWKKARNEVEEVVVLTSDASSHVPEWITIVQAGGEIENGVTKVCRLTRTSLELVITRHFAAQMWLKSHDFPSNFPIG
jgi:hypothetical protein